MKKSDVNNQFIRRLKMVMALQNVSQVELARRCDVTTAAVSQWMKGTTTPTLKRVEEIAKALHVKVDSLLAQHEISPVQGKVIPVVSAVSYPFNKDEFVAGYTVVVDSPNHEFFAIQVSKDFDTLKSGDIAIAETSASVYYGALSVVVLNHATKITRIAQASGGIILYGDGTPIYLSDADCEEQDFHYVARVLEIQRKA